MRFKIFAIAVVLALPSVALADKTAEVNQYLSQKLTDNYAARAIGSNCSSIRTVESKIGKAMMGLNKTLKGQGYSRADIKNGMKGIKFPAMKKAGYNLVISKGASADDESSFCQVGAAEIANKTYIGSVLKAK